MAKKLVAPSILSADFANLEKEIAAVTLAGADWLHIDVMDGHFVNNITIGIPVVAAIKKVAKIPLDVHLMIEQPENYVDQFIDAGADYLTLHVESSYDIEKALKRIKVKGAKAGITLRPKTSIFIIEPLLHLVDLVLVMTVDPGFGGQSFMEDQLLKVHRLYNLRKEKNFNFLIEVDGGVSAETAPLCHEADVLVAGSYVFKRDYKTAIEKLQNS